MKHIMEELFKTNRWYLLSTKSSSEKAAYDNLNNQGRETFAPSKNFISLFFKLSKMLVLLHKK